MIASPIRSSAVPQLRIKKGAPIYEAARLVLKSGITADDAHQLLRAAILIAALEQSHGNITRAARIMDVGRETVRRQMRLLNLRPLPAEIRRKYRDQLNIKFPSKETA